MPDLSSPPPQRGDHHVTPCRADNSVLPALLGFLFIAGWGVVVALVLGWPL